MGVGVRTWRKSTKILTDKCRIDAIWAQGRLTSRLAVTALHPQGLAVWLWDCQYCNLSCEIFMAVARMTYCGRRAGAAIGIFDVGAGALRNLLEEECPLEATLLDLAL